MASRSALHADAAGLLQIRDLLMSVGFFIRDLQTHGRLEEILRGRRPSANPQYPANRTSRDDSQTERSAETGSTAPLRRTAEYSLSIHPPPEHTDDL